MKIIKVIYNSDTKFIKEIVNKFSDTSIIEAYNCEFYKHKKKAREIMERFGTKKVPLIVFEDENLEEYTAIWSESNPDWEKEIKNKLYV